MAVFRLVLVLLWVGVTASSVVNLEKRIIGGRDCRPGERPYHVRVNTTNGTHWGHCGGSLIRNRWILTAAHCWEEGWDITVFLGVNSGQEMPINIFDSPKIFKNVPNFDEKHDLMLLKLPENTQIPASVTPVKLPDSPCNQPAPGEVVQIAGQGAPGPTPIPGFRVTRRPAFTPTLQCADISVVDCPSGWGPSHMNLFCGETWGVDACKGDSGGGVEYRGRIYGVIKSGHRYVCGRPAIFMNLCHRDYMTWILKTTEPTKQPTYLKCLDFLKKISSKIKMNFQLSKTTCPDKI